MKNLTKGGFEKLFPDATRRHYDKGQVIYYTGDKPHHAYFVLSGHIKYYDIDKEGNEKILHIVGPNNIFPMLYAFNVSPEISGFYVTIDKVEVMIISLDEFQAAAKTNVEFCYELTRWFLTEIEQLVFRINSFEKTDSREKVLHALKYLATDYGEANGAWRSLNLPVTHQFIADFTGLTRETVSAIMQELERDKVVKPLPKHRYDVSKAALQKLN